MNTRISITTTLPYVNAKPHIGHALEFVQADIVARYYRLIGSDVFFNTGTDEHGLKVYRKALEAGKDTQEYVNEYAQGFKVLLQKLNVSNDAFIRTTDPHHKKAAQEFWRRCEQNGDIYKKEYKVKYCVGCELEKTESDLHNGVCPDHPTTPIEVLEEENYFFRFSKYEKQLLAWYEEHPSFVKPVQRQNEIRAFVARGLQDFSISRLKEKMPWGVPVPDDDAHVMYVWFDALVNYLSTLGWPEKGYEVWWPSIQFAGKDNLRQQSAMWQAMLLSAGEQPSREMLIHGFITSGGMKMSKSVGNVIDPLEVIDVYGAEALRYILARHVHPFEDTDLTKEALYDIYTANLVNGLGNLVSRVMKMATSYGVEPYEHKTNECGEKVIWEHIVEYEFNRALDTLWARVGALDARIQEVQPFKMIKEDEESAKREVAYLVSEVYAIGHTLQPFMPETAQKIMHTVTAHTMPEPLFPRVERS